MYFTHFKMGTNDIKSISFTNLSHYNFEVNFILNLNFIYFIDLSFLNHCFGYFSFRGINFGIISYLHLKYQLLAISNALDFNFMKEDF